MDQLDSLVPVCLEDKNGRIDQIGTGVLINFRDILFILTAGHILDAQNYGSLLIPSGENVICGIEGSYSYFNPLGDREKDMMDFGYIKLDNEYAKAVTKLFKPIKESEIAFSEDLSEYDIVSFSGYPYRKSRAWDDKIKTELYSYSASLANSNEYIQYGCNTSHHIVAKFNRKNSISTFNMKKTIPPLPHGISGGGVFVWPRKFKNIPPIDRKLIAISHTFKEISNCFIATKISVFLKSILYNNPEIV